MKHYYIAVQVMKKQKLYAYYLREPENRNIWHDLNSIPGICVAQIMPTKKAAEATVIAWNDSFKNNRIYMFDTMPDGSPAPF